MRKSGAAGMRILVVHPLYPGNPAPPLLPALRMAG
jgi:hypothetical protein